MCKLETTGSCRGCPAIDVAAAVIRIDGKSAEELTTRLTPICPPGYAAQENVLYERAAEQRGNLEDNSACEMEA